MRGYNNISIGENRKLKRRKKMWMSYKDVADYLGVSVSAVRKWVAQGRLRAYRVSHKTVRFKKADVDAFVEQRATRRRGRRPSFNFPM